VLGKKFLNEKTEKSSAKNTAECDGGNEEGTHYGKLSVMIAGFCTNFEGR